MLPINYFALLESTNIHRYIKDHNINATGLKASSKSNKIHVKPFYSTYTNPFAEFPLSLPKKINSLGHDNFTMWRRAKWGKCSIKTKDKLKGGKDLISSVDSREALEGVI